MGDNNLKIGLAFSGGGFRASSFSLGVLTYLNHVIIVDEPLLKKVIALSTVSGGSITGMRYTMGIKKGESLDRIYESLYRFMSEADLINMGLNRLISKKDWDSRKINSLICAFADVYDSELFAYAKFGMLMSDAPPIHLKHISFNATEFANALQFRFQHTEKLKHQKKDELVSGVIGNSKYRIPANIAQNIRMGDILAASSCFPGGFEPINFPDDFGVLSAEENNDYLNSEKFPVGLMDGGIVDNQGIEPLLLAEDRMKCSVGKDAAGEDTPNVMDLLIISDVTSPYMENYKASTQQKKKLWRKFTPRGIFGINLLCLLGALFGAIYHIINGGITLAIFFSCLSTINIMVFGIFLFVRSLPKKFHVPGAFLKPIRKLFKIRLVAYENMVLNRSNSLLKMTNDVFLKHIRRLNYDRIYTDKSWKNRRIMNAVYELRDGEEKLENKFKTGKLDKNLKPSDKLKSVAGIAASMGTTLWFSKEELEKKNMLDCIIACGQFTMCWNLLEYISIIKRDTENTNENHTALMSCESSILGHWEKFNQDPFWMVKEHNKKFIKTDDC